MPRRKFKGLGWLKARYGSTLRRRYTEIWIQAHTKYLCPKCGFKTLERESIGIWKCRKCGLTMAGGAYQPTTKVGAKLRF